MLEPRQVKTIADAKAIVEQRNLTHVKVGVFDIDGIMRGKYMSRAKFLSALESGYGFCDVVLGWDCQDQLYDNVQFTGWHTGYPDAPVRILPGLVPAAAVRRRRSVLPRASSRRPRSRCVRAACCAGCSSGRAAWASRPTPASSTKCSSSTRRRSRCAQKNYRDLQADGAGLVRLLGDPQQRRRGLLPPDARDVRGDGFRHRRSARGDRPRRDRGGDRASTARSPPPTRRRCSRPSSRCSRSATA